MTGCMKRNRKTGDKDLGEDALQGNTIYEKNVSTCGELFTLFNLFPPENLLWLCISRSTGDYITPERAC